MKLNSIKLILATLILSSCALAPLARDVNLPSNEETIVFLKISPENIAIQFSAGYEEDGVFRESKFAESIIVKPSNGYAVFKVKAGNTYAATKLVQESLGGALGIPYIACEGGTTLTFKSPPGKVIYLADGKFEVVNERLMQYYSYNYIAALNFMNSNYRNLSSTSNNLVMEPITQPKVTKSCLQINYY